jgi:hypothetical protein
MSLRAKALDYDALPLKLLLSLPFYWLWLVKEIIQVWPYNNKNNLEQRLFSRTY